MPIYVMYFSSLAAVTERNHVGTEGMSYITLTDLDNPIKLFTMFYKGDNFCVFLFALLKGTVNQL